MSFSDIKAKPPRICKKVRGFIFAKLKDFEFSNSKFFHFIKVKNHGLWKVYVLKKCGNDVKFYRNSVIVQNRKCSNLSRENYERL